MNVALNSADSADQAQGAAVSILPSESWSKPIDALDAATAIALARIRLWRHGARVMQSTAFERIHDEIVATSKGKLNLESSPYYSDLTEGDAAYIVVRGQDEQIIGFCSARRFSIGPAGLSDHLRRQYRRIYGAGEDAFHFEELPPLLHRISGSVGFVSDVYTGETIRSWINPGTMTLLAYGQCIMGWGVDWIYGFTKYADARRGLAKYYSTAHVAPSAIRWRVQTPNRRDDDWFHCLSREDAGYVMRNYIRDTEGLVNSDLLGKGSDGDGTILQANRK